MRRIISFLLLCCLLSSFIQPALAADGPELIASIVSVHAGGTAEISVSIKNNPGISSLRIFLQYDTNVLTPQKKSDNSLAVFTSDLTKSGILFSSATENGIQILWGAEQNIKEDGILFTVKLDTDAFAFGDLPIVITYLPEDTTNTEGQEIGFTITNGSIAVEKSAVICVGEATGVSGGEVTVPVSVQQNPGFATAVLSFSYDPEVLELTSIKKGSLLKSESGSFTRNVSAGRVAWFDSINTTGDGVIFELVFSVLDQEAYTKTTVTAALTNGAGRNFGNTSNDAIPVCFVQGNVSLRPGKLEVQSIDFVSNGNVILQLNDAPASEIMVIIAAYQNGKMISVSPKKQICNIGENQLTYDHPSGADTVKLFLLHAENMTPLWPVAIIWGGDKT